MERKAFGQQRLGQYEQALITLEKLMASQELANDSQRRAWLAASAARIAYQMEDEPKGQKLQTTAFTVNNNHSPPRVCPVYTSRPAPGKQSIAIVNRLLEYGQRGAVIADFDEAVADLVPEASPARYEEALSNLGAYLGFEAERPDKVYKVGPDVLWRTDGAFDFLIEAKSDKEEDNPLYKKEHAQLLEAEQWYKQKYPERNALRVSALPEAIADEKATPAGSYALTLDDVTKLASALRGVLVEIAGATGGPESLREQCQAALEKANLQPSGIRAKFMKPFGKAEAKPKSPKASASA
jgi:replicative superfamily II helicase